MFSTCPFVRPSVCSFVCYQTCEHDILKSNKPNLLQIGKLSMGQGHEKVKSGGQEVKDEGHRRRNIVLEAF